MSAAPQGYRKSDLLFVHDTQSRRKWLVDGGAFVSLLPPTHTQRVAGPVEGGLEAANGTFIACYGTVSHTVHLGDREYTFDFTIADVKQPILGADFLATNSLAPNHRDGTLIDINDLSIITAQFDRAAQSQGINFINQKNDPYYKLLDKYPSLSTPNFTPKEVKHNVRHYIPTTGRPVQSKARKLCPEKLQIAKEQLDTYVKLGIARRAKSEWSSPLLVTPKPRGGWRVCGDFRRVNTQTIDDKYPVKALSDFNADLAGKVIFSKVDLLKGYHQIPVAEEDIPKTGVITPFGLFVFDRTPFGLKNAGQDFQRLMDEIFCDIPHTFVYIDDILVASTSIEEHLRDLERVFSTLDANGLVLNRSKCVFGVSELEFLGFHVDKHGVRPLDDRVKALQETASPTTVTELRRYMGMMNYYRRCFPKAAHHFCPLFDALKGNPKKLNWTPALEEAFQASKAALSTFTMLHHPRVGAPLAITSDASKVAVGAVLEQRGPSGWEPLGFYSSKLSKDKPDQTMWPPFDRELLGVFRAVRHFRHMVEGKPFTIYTDQQAIVPSLHKKTDPLTARQAYQLSCIAEFSTDIRYLEGKANVVADALSRPNGIDERTVNMVSNGDHLFAELIRVNSIQPASGATFSESENPPHTPTTRVRFAPKNLPAAACPYSSANNGGPASILKQPAEIQLQLPPPNKLGQLPLQRTTSSGVRTCPTATTPISHINRPLSKDKILDFQSVIAAVNATQIDLAEIARAQPLDADYQRISRDARSGLSFRRIDIGNQDLLVDISNGLPRPFVPLNLRRTIFDVIHGLGHPGTHRTAEAVASKFVWPSVRADCTKWARECLACQRSKVTRNTTPEIGEFEVPSKRFAHLHIDIVHMPASNGFAHLLTIVDRFTRWPAAIPLRDISAESVIDAFSHGWVANFGIPAAITSDRGSQFTGALWEQLLGHWGITPLRTTAYHPEANGLVERLHRRLKEALIAIGDGNPAEWFWRLPSALLAIRTTLKPDIGSTPADLVYGEGLTVPGDLLGNLPSDGAQLQRQRQTEQARLRLEVARLQPTPTSAHRKPAIYVPHDLEDATHVFVRRGGVQSSLTSPYEGPFRVIRRTAAGYRILMSGGREETIAISRLKPAHMDDLEDAEQLLDDARPPSPPPPGRRPGVRTRIPQATDRVTRQQSRRSAANRPTTSNQPTTSTAANQPTAANRPPTSVRNPRRSLNIDEYNTPIPPPPSSAPSNAEPHCVADPLPPTSAPSNAEPHCAADAPHPSAPLDSSGSGARGSSTPMSPSVVNPATHELAGRLQRLRAEALQSEQLFTDEDDPTNQPSLFELGNPIGAGNGSTSAPADDPFPLQQSRRHGPANLPRRRFSSVQREPGRRYYSDPRRPRPDVSAIFEHLNLSSGVS